MRHDLIREVGDEILTAKLQNLRTPIESIDSMLSMTPAEVVAVCLHIVSHTDAAPKSCSYMTSLTHHLAR